MKATPAVLVLALVFAACAPPRPLIHRVAEADPEVVFMVATTDSLVALTLDDGPSADVTPHVLALLARHDARATFFLTGNRIEGREGLVRQIVLHGHELGNHGMSSMPSLLLPRGTFRRDLRRAHTLLTEYDTVRWFRPATGLFNERIVREAAALGYTTALGSVYPNDVHRPFPGLLSRHVLRHVEPGSVIILHEGRTGRRTIVPVLERILPELRRRGYRMVTLSELVEAAGWAEDGA
jgi:peptidoglycan-N-acetylglucosamine deacetylase